MKEYIEREALLERLSYNSPTNLPPMEYCREVVSKYPAADVAPVVHGEWMPYTFTTTLPAEFDENGNLIEHEHMWYKCSVCDRHEPNKEPYCHCGAKMDGGNKNDNI